MTPEDRLREAIHALIVAVERMVNEGDALAPAKAIAAIKARFAIESARIRSLPLSSNVH